MITRLIDFALVVLQALIGISKIEIFKFSGKEGFFIFAVTITMAMMKYSLETSKQSLLGVLMEFHALHIRCP